MNLYFGMTLLWVTGVLMGFGAGMLYEKKFPEREEE
jgi:hypothetical protein